MSWAKLPDNPFVGLRPFESHESLLFFGRHEQSVELLEQLHANRFLAVVGSSGSGKSSLVRAGLVPKLQGGFLVDDRDLWRVATMKPGDAPLGNLVAALAAELGETDDDDALTGEVRERGVLVILERAAETLAEGANLLLLVDQFEELFRFGLHTAAGERGEEAAHFVSILLELAAQREAPIYVVMTMRSDFLGDCDAFHGLPEAMNRGQYLVPRLTRRQRREAIDGPVRLYRAEIAPRLVDRLLNETVDARDDLPILQHALMRTWAAWAGAREGPIDVEHYAAIGTIAQALERHAEEAMEGLDEEDEALTRRIFQALTETDTGNRRIRRPARLGEIEAITGRGRAAIMGIIDRFRSDGRTFLFISGDEGGSNATVDISHESLIRQWRRLAEWVDEEAESARTFRRLAADTALYREKKGELYRGAALEVAEQWERDQAPTAHWAARYGYDLAPVLGFIVMSRKAEEKEIREQEDRRRRELRRTRLVAAVLGIAFLLTLVLGFWAFRQQRIAAQERTAARQSEQDAIDARKGAERSEKDAIEARTRAERSEQSAIEARTRAEESEQDAIEARTRAEQALRLAEKRRLQVLARQLERSSAEALERGGHEKAALLALESLAASPTELGFEALETSIEQLLRPPAEVVSFPAENTPRRFALDPTGRWLAFVMRTEPVRPTSGPEDDESLVLVDLTGGSETRFLELGTAQLFQAGSGRTLAVSPDGRWIAGGGHKAAYVWSTSSNQQVRQLWGPPPVDAPDSPTIGSAARATEPADPRDAGHSHWLSRALTNGNDDMLGTLAFSPDGGVLYAVTGDDAVHRFETTDWTELPPLRDDRGAVLSVTATADGELLATGSALGAALWSTRSGERLATYDTGRYSDDLSGLSISDDRKLVAARFRGHGNAGVLILRCPALEPGSVAEMELLADWRHDAGSGGGFDQAELSPDGRLLVVRQHRRIQLLELDRAAVPSTADPRTRGEFWRRRILNVLYGARHLALLQDRFAVAFRNEVGLWSWRPNEEEAHFIPRPGDISALAFNSDGRFLFSLAAGTFAIHDGETLAAVPFAHPDPPVRGLRLSPDGSWLAVAGASSLRVLEIGSWREAVPAIALEADVRPRFAFTKDSRHLVALLGPRVLVVEPRQATVSPSLAHGLSTVSSIRLSPEGRWLEVRQQEQVDRGGNVQRQGRTRIVELGSGREVGPEAPGLPGPSAWTEVTLPGVAGPRIPRENERWRVDGLQTAHIRAYPRRPADLRTEACARLSRNLSKAEWKEYLLGEPYRPTCTSWRLHE